MINQFSRNKFFVAFVAFFTAITFGIQTLSAQTKPLTLGEILTGLQSKSGGFSLAQKNSFITSSVMKRGVTFRMSPVIQNELKQVGASTGLLRAILIKAPKPVSSSLPRATNPKPPTAKIDRVWVDQNYTFKGLQGIRLHAKFNVSNRKEQNVFLNVRFRNSANKPLLTTDKNYSNGRGELAVGRTLTPKYSSTVFNDQTFFIPYTKFNLPAGSHNLKVDLDILYPSGKTISHLTLHDFVLVKRAPSLFSPKVRFDRVWIEYDKTYKGKLGMIVHQKFVVSNLKGERLQVRALFSKRTGSRMIPLMAKTGSVNKTRSGKLGFFTRLTPGHKSTAYSDFKFFVPYSELKVGNGVHALSMRIDLIYPSGSLLQHFTEKALTFRKGVRR